MTAGVMADPLSVTLCVAYPGAPAFRLLSVSVSEPVMEPGVVGLKLMASSQAVPAGTVPGVDAPLPTTGQAEGALSSSVKLAAMDGLLPEARTGRVRSALPMFWSVMLCGLSELVATTGVA